MVYPINWHVQYSIWLLFIWIYIKSSFFKVLNGNKKSQPPVIVIQTEMTGKNQAYLKLKSYIIQN